MYIRVDAVPKAKKERVTKIGNGRLKIEVKEPATNNLANKRIREVLAEHFGVTPPQVRMLTGHRSSSKMYSIEEETLKA